MDLDIMESPARDDARNRTLGVASLIDTGICNILSSQAKYKLSNALGFAECILDVECQKVATAIGDERWATLSRVAFRLARLGAAGDLREDEVRWHLECAAVAAEMHHFHNTIDAAFVESTRPYFYVGRSNG
jgi:hypothetical protein